MIDKEKIPRWIYASGATHFRDIVVAAGYDYTIEGQKRDTRIKKTFVEYRMDGPDEKDSSGSTTYEFVINVMIQHAMDTAYIYRHHDIAGLLQKGFWNLLPIKNHGEEEVIIIGCARLVEDHKGRSVRVVHLGQIDPDTHIQRSAVMGRYELSLTK